MHKFIITLGLAVALAGCTSLKPATSGSRESTAVVTSIANGRASVPNERVYGLRTDGGRVYFTTQVLRRPLKEGERVEIELGSTGSVHIREMR